MVNTQYYPRSTKRIIINAVPLGGYFTKLIRTNWTALAENGVLCPLYSPTFSKRLYSSALDCWAEGSSGNRDGKMELTYNSEFTEVLRGKLSSDKTAGLRERGRKANDCNTVTLSVDMSHGARWSLGNYFALPGRRQSIKSTIHNGTVR